MAHLEPSRENRLREAAKRDFSDAHELEVEAARRYAWKQGRVVDFLWMHYTDQAWWWKFLEQFGEKFMLAAALTLLPLRSAMFLCATVLIITLSMAKILKPWASESKEHTMFMASRSTNLFNIVVAISEEFDVLGIVKSKVFDGGDGGDGPGAIDAIVFDVALAAALFIVNGKTTIMLIRNLDLDDLFEKGRLVVREYYKFTAEMAERRRKELSENSHALFEAVLRGDENAVAAYLHAGGVDLTFTCRPETAFVDHEDK